MPASAAYVPVESPDEERASVPHTVSRWMSLLDIDDAPMLRKREVVMNVCIVQVLLSFVLLTNFRRSPVLLVLQPFFIAAGVLGYLGAKHCKALYVAAHFVGSAGLALVFLIFILAETFLKHAQKQQHASADLYFIIINAPMDLFLLSTSGASVVLFFSLQQLKKQLRQRREHIREQFEAVSRGEGVPGGAGGVPPGLVGLELSVPGERAEERRRGALKQDLRCPITLEVMRDPVIAGDGHSYEREAIDRWLRGHRTSPLTGRVMASSQLLPNHRLRTLIQELEAGAHAGAAAAASSASAAAAAAAGPRVVGGGGGGFDGAASSSTADAEPLWGGGPASDARAP